MAYDYPFNNAIVAHLVTFDNWETIAPALFAQVSLALEPEVLIEVAGTRLAGSIPAKFLIINNASVMV